MGKQQEAIKCPKSGRRLTVSRDVAQAIKYSQEEQAKKQKEINNKIKNASNVLTNKYYTGVSKDIEIAVKFDDHGKVNDLADPKVELKNELAKLDGQTKEAVEKAIYQFMLCMNQALEEKNTDMESKLKDIIEPAAKSA